MSENSKHKNPLNAQAESLLRIMKRKQKPAPKQKKQKFGTEKDDWLSFDFADLDFDSPEWRARFAESDRMLAEMPPLDLHDPDFDFDSPECKARFAELDRMLAVLPPLDLSSMPTLDLAYVSPLPNEALSSAPTQKNSPKKRRRLDNLRKRGRTRGKKPPK